MRSPASSPVCIALLYFFFSAGVRALSNPTRFECRIPDRLFPANVGCCFRRSVHFLPILHRMSIDTGSCLWYRSVGRISRGIADRQSKPSTPFPHANSLFIFCYKHHIGTIHERLCIIAAVCTYHFNAVQLHSVSSIHIRPKHNKNRIVTNIQFAENRVALKISRLVLGIFGLHDNNRILQNGRYLFDHAVCILRVLIFKILEASKYIF